VERGSGVFLRKAGAPRRCLLKKRPGTTERNRTPQPSVMTSKSPGVPRSLGGRVPGPELRLVPHGLRELPRCGHCGAGRPHNGGGGSRSRGLSDAPVAEIAERERIREGIAGRFGWETTVKGIRLAVVGRTTTAHSTR
jgi:hypothetical protein